MTTSPDGQSAPPPSSQIAQGGTAPALPSPFVAQKCARTEAPPSDLPAGIRETYGHCGEDLVVEGLLSARLALASRSLASAFYIEIGANHPVQASDTYLLYHKHGASGVLVEANEALIETLRRARPRDVVLHTAISASSEPSVAFGVCAISELSSLSIDPIKSFGSGAPIASSTAPNLHINDLLARCGGRPIDFLSIDVEGADYEILEAADFSRFRPLVIQCKPSEHFAPGTLRRMAGLLRERSYQLAAQTAVNLIFADALAPGCADRRPAINCFDVFDTLISRRCIDPLRVFAAMEAELRIPGLAALRREAELAVSGPGLTFDAIHAELAGRLGPASPGKEALQQAEVRAELGQAIPIAENLAHVRDGDMLVSDMYLPAGVIRALLDKAGLDRRVGLLVSADGKASGWVWPELQREFSVRSHLGDNAHADVAMPARFGIAAERTRLAEPTNVERWFLDAGLGELGELMRAARLRSFSPDPVARSLMLVQTQLNFPILLRASAALRRHAAAAGAQRLLFASRDCNLWLELYRALFPDGPEAEYFYTSRRARVQPSAAYRRYVRARLSPDSLLIDLCGSGWSSSLLVDALGLSERSLYFLHRIAAVPLYEQLRATPGVCRIDALIGPERAGLDHQRLEMCNYAAHGSVLDVREVGGAAAPVVDADGRSGHTLALVAQQAACFRSMAAEAGGLRRSLDALRGDVVPEIVAQLYVLLSREGCLAAAYGAPHYDEDMRTLRALQVMPPAHRAA
jgi:FkbM family methyltransferase